jgi:hypothetical protein
VQAQALPQGLAPEPAEEVAESKKPRPAVLRAAAAAVAAAEPMAWLSGEAEEVEAAALKHAATEPAVAMGPAEVEGADFDFCRQSRRSQPYARAA